MDLRLYGQVLWRHKLVVVAGLVLASFFAFLSYVSVSRVDGDIQLTYRSKEVWQNTASLLLTQRGFPEGRSIFPPVKQPLPGELPQPPSYADPGRFAGLADLYAAIATSDEVQALIRQDGPLTGTIGARTVPSTSGGSTPILNLFATGPTPEAATRLVRRATAGFLRYIETAQGRAAIPPRQRVDLAVLKASENPVVIAPRKKTLPVVVFVAILVLSVALAFALENARQRSAVSVVREPPPVLRSEPERPDVSRRTG